METILKTCRKCLNDFPATLEYFYKHPSGKYGITPRCKKCVKEDNIASQKKRDPEIVRKQANKRAKRHYHRNLEQSRERAKQSAAKMRLDPQKKLIIQSRKRAGGAGLTPEQIEDIRKEQNNLCAICSTPNPTDLDHCHKTHSIRWLLCRHCNRGLGAFRDSPEFLRKAADMLESFKR